LFKFFLGGKTNEIIDFETGKVIKTIQQVEEIKFSKWISNNVIVFTIKNALYKWDHENDQFPIQLFQISSRIEDQIFFNIQSNEKQDWILLNSFSDYNSPSFNFQLYSCERNITQVVSFFGLIQKNINRVYMHHFGSVFIY
jgi:hypothetical protein